MLQKLGFTPARVIRPVQMHKHLTRTISTTRNVDEKALDLILPLT